MGYIDNVRFGQNGAMLPGDFDDNGVVNGNDFLVWQRGGTEPPLDPSALAEWQNAYGAASTPTLAAIPEPSAGVLLVSGLLGLLARRRNRSV